MRNLAFIRPLGSGAVGTVYLAEIESGQGFRRQVAVKVLLTGTPGVDLFLTRMRDEARLLGLLRDDRILGVVDLVRVADRDAVIMEYVEGVDLASLVEGGHRIPSRAMAELGAMAAGALHKAHVAVHPVSREALNVVHRDVKPANLMVTVQGGVKLLDFGVARARFEARESYTGQLMLGTLNYMAPEYIVTGEVTCAADIYGLGVSLLEVASGEAFGQPRIRRERFEERVKEALGAIDESHGELAPVLGRMLSWDPEARPDGLTLEDELLEMADGLKGPSLRSWASQVVAPALRERGQVHEDPVGLAGSSYVIQGSVMASADDDGVSPEGGVAGSPTLIPPGPEDPPAANPRPATETAPSTPPPPVVAAPAPPIGPPGGRRAPRPDRPTSSDTLRVVFQSLLAGAAIGVVVVAAVAAFLLTR